LCSACNKKTPNNLQQPSCSPKQNDTHVYTLQVTNAAPCCICFSLSNFVQCGIALQEEFDWSL